MVPVGLASRLEVDADLFVSTWALNESTAEAQRLVLDRDWFGAESMLLAMHSGDPFDAAVLAAGAVPVPVGDHIPQPQYLVR